MTHGMAAEQIAAEKHDVGRKKKRADADAERCRSRRRIDPPQALPHIHRQDEQHGDREKHHVAMDVLQDERKRILAPVARARLAHRAGRRVGPERFVIGAAIVVARDSKKRRDRQDQQCRRKWHPRRPRRRFGSEPAMRRRSENFRGVKRREIWSERVVIALECRPRRVDEKRRETQEHEQWLDPPGVAARGFPKPAHCHADGRSQCGHATDPRMNTRKQIATSTPIPGVRRCRRRRELTVVRAPLRYWGTARSSIIRAPVSCDDPARGRWCDHGLRLDGFWLPQAC